MKKLIIIVLAVASYIQGAGPHNRQSYQVPLPSGVKNLSIINDNSTTYFNGPRPSEPLRYTQSIVNDPEVSSSQTKPWLSYCKGHTVGLAFIVGSLGYGAVLANVLYLATTVQGSTGWSQWHAGMIKYQAQEQHKMLANELFETIKRKYASKTNTVLDPLVCFMNDCEKELKVMQKFIRWRAWLATTKLALIFPAQEETVAIATEKIAHIEFLKKLLVNQLSEYCVDVA